MVERRTNQQGRAEVDMARRVILEMDVHCTNCAMKIRRAVQNHLGTYVR